MNPISISRFSVAVAAVLAAGPIAAQQPVDPAREKVERADARLREFQEAEITDPTVFVKSAALGDLTGIELAKVAQSKAENAGVKTLAARLLKDHTAAYSELTAIAKRKRMDVPNSLVYEDEQVVNEAAGKSGAEFDSWYGQRMITESQKAVALFQAAAKMQDAELAAFAKKTLPVLEEHQRLAAAL